MSSHVDMMAPLLNIVILMILAGLFLGGLRLGIISKLADRPLVTMIAAMGVGILYRRIGLPEPDGELTRQIARFGLALLAFLAAQQCRISRLHAVSRPAFRLALFGPPLFLLLFVATGFAMLPGLDLTSTLIAGVAIVLGGAPAVAGPLLSAPVDDEVKCAARIEGAMALTLALPIALLIEAGAMEPETAAIHRHPLFLTLSGFAFGGTIGLLAGRFLPPSSAPLPVLPFLVALIAYFSGILTGFDPVMTTLAAGLLYSVEAPIRGEVRTRLWRSGERLLLPAGFIGFGFLLGPAFLHMDLLIWVAALGAVTIARGAARFIAVQGLELPPQDRTFLVWYGGAPGTASALFMLSLIASPVILADERAMVLASTAIFVGLIITRVGSGPLTTRLVHETARAKKRRYSPA